MGSSKLPFGKKLIGLKWVFKTRFQPNGDVLKYKARLVTKGYSQTPGIDYEEVFSPVARMETVRMFFVVATQRKWTIHQLDVKSTFLNGEILEEVYVEQPPRFVRRGHEDEDFKGKKGFVWPKTGSPCVV